MEFKRYTVSDNDYYLAEVDEYDGVVFGHIYFRVFNKTAYQRFLREWALFRKTLTAPVFVYSQDGTNKFHKFITRIGFRKTDMMLQCNNGEVRPIYVSVQ